MRGVTTEREIRDCQDRLKDVLIKGLDQESYLTIRYKGGGSKPYPVNHNGVVWFCSRLELENRFWNAFGLYPDENGQNNITVEINPPRLGINLSKGQGMFAYDQEGSLFLLHGGGIGGGRKGIGKSEFLKWYLQYEHMRDVEIDGGSRKKAILVGKISDEGSFLDDLEEFIRRVRVFKMLAVKKKIGDQIDALRSALQNMEGNIGPPGSRTTTVSIYRRNPEITHLAKLMARGICCLCKQEGPFMDQAHVMDQVPAFPFLETHHVKWLSKGGKDSIDNTVALCPNCHRKMHHVDDKGDMAALRKIAKEQARLLRRRKSRRNTPALTDLPNQRSCTGE